MGEKKKRDCYVATSAVESFMPEVATRYLKRSSSSCLSWFLKSVPEALSTACRLHSFCCLF